MKLPISYEDAVKEWDRFEDYLVQERYAVRDPETGEPIHGHSFLNTDKIINDMDSPE